MDRKLLDVLAEAVDAYQAMALRRKSHNGKQFVIQDLTAEKLVKKFPQHYSIRADGKTYFIGKAAGDILEDYLEGLGYERRSARWSHLMTVVVTLAKDENK
jgi:hypothetical protein|tara:strand:+ start:210 stop:512 length:303 start_codon:yes stop_codon:yes gene_type:complete